MHTLYPIEKLAQLPALLTEITDKPTSLYIRGSLPDESCKYLAIVGSRKYTPYGKQACERLIKGLAGYPVVIVSGLALGIDGIAHEAALDAGLRTIAIPGSGLDDSVLYPATHKNLAQRILDADGSLLSEFEPMWKPRPESFPQRNRIMAGMSHAVLVIEATLRSGTLITSRLATEYNRDVLAVPGPIHSETSRGPHMLIKKGAALAETAEDILEVLNIDISNKTAPTYKELSPDEQKVMLYLKEPKARDELIVLLNKTASEASIILSSLELKGVIHEYMGKIMIR